MNEVLIRSDLMINMGIDIRVTWQEIDVDAFLTENRLKAILSRIV